MELGPIPGIRALSEVRAREADIRPQAIFEIDAPAKPGDGSSQQNGKKAAGAEESDEVELTVETEDALGAEKPDDRRPGRIDTFA